MGMTYEQYWEEPPYLVVAYRKAYRLRKKAENEQAWLQGLYVFDAFAVCLANAFSKRGAKKITYVEKPIDIFPLTAEEQEQKRREEIEKSQRAMKEMIRRQQQRKKQKGEN